MEERERGRREMEAKEEEQDRRGFYVNNHREQSDSGGAYIVN